MESHEERSVKPTIFILVLFIAIPVLLALTNLVVDASVNAFGETPPPIGTYGPIGTPAKPPIGSPIPPIGTPIPPTNDDLSGAVVISSLPYSTSQSTVFATLETGEPVYSCGADVGGTVWYSFTPASDGLFTAHTSADFDTVMHVFEDTSGLPLVVCGDDDITEDDLDSRVTFEGKAGSTYLISIGGYNGAYGDLSIYLEKVCPNPNSLCVTAQYPNGAQAFYLNGDVKGSDGSWVEYDKIYYHGTYIEFVNIAPGSDYVVAIGANGLFIVEENVTAPETLTAAHDSVAYVTIETKDADGNLFYEYPQVYFTYNNASVWVGAPQCQGWGCLDEPLVVAASPKTVHIDAWTAKFDIGDYYFYQPDHTLVDGETISLDASTLPYETIELNLDGISNLRICLFSPTINLTYWFGSMYDEDLVHIVAPLDSIQILGFNDYSIWDDYYDHSWRYGFVLPSITMDTHAQNTIVNIGGTLTGYAYPGNPDYQVGETGEMYAEVLDSHGNPAWKLRYYDYSYYYSTSSLPDESSGSGTILEKTAAGELVPKEVVFHQDPKTDQLSVQFVPRDDTTVSYGYTRYDPDPDYYLNDADSNPVSFIKHGSELFEYIEFTAAAPIGTWEGGFTIDVGPMGGVIGDSVLFTVTNPLQDKPSLIAPTGTIAEQSPTYSWNAVDHADLYLMVVKKNGTDVVTWMWGNAGDICSAGTCTATPGKLLGAGDYTWWVVGNNAAGFGPWSLPGNFTLEGRPDRPDLYAPDGTIFDQTPTYSWEDVYSAEDYLLVVKKNGTDVVTWMWSAAGDICTAGTCEVDPGKKLGAGSYTFWVIGRNTSYGFGFWSLPKVFTTEGTPDQPALYAPTGTISEAAPEYSWEDVYSAEQYVLVVKDSGSNVEVWTTYNAGDICSAGTCAVSPAGVILPDDSYTWVVLPKNSYGNGFWSLPESFTVAAP